MKQAAAFVTSFRSFCLFLLLSGPGATGWAAEDTSFAIENSYACLTEVAMRPTRGCWTSMPVP